jgi:alpha-beta hydrolase superfamily lysophospholipase
MGETFPAFDGIDLWAEDYPPARRPARASVLIVHGYAEHGGRYVAVARRLAGAGFAVTTLDHRGHGRAGGPRGHCARFTDFVADLERAIARLEPPIVLVAVSHGALVALRALVEPARFRLPGVVGAVLVSPFLGIKLPVPGWKVVLGRVASRLAPRLSLPNGLVADDFSHDPVSNAAWVNDPLTLRVATARWFTEMSAAQELCAARAGRIELPTLWLVAGDDRVVDADRTRRVFAAAGGDKQMLVYEGLFHELFNEVEKEQVLVNLDAWLASRFPMPPLRA